MELKVKMLKERNSKFAESVEVNLKDQANHLNSSSAYLLFLFRYAKKAKVDNSGPHKVS